MSKFDDYQDLFDKISEMTIWTTPFSIVPIIQKLIKKEITKEECLKRIVKLTGYKAARVLVLIGLLSFPLTAMPTSIYLVMKYSTMVVEIFQGKKPYNKSIN